MNLSQQVLHQLSQQSGLAGLAFDASGLCQLRVENFKLALYDNRALHGLTLLCELPSQTAQAWDATAQARWALTYQFKALHEDLPIIGLNPRTDTLTAMQHIPLPQLSLERLSHAIMTLIDWAKNWEQEVLALNPTSDRAPLSPLPKTPYT